MSTRGFVGYKKDGVTRGWYNHSDSYLSGLGINVIDKYNTLTQDELNDFFTNKLSLLPDTRENQCYYDNHKSIFTADWKRNDCVYMLLNMDESFLDEPDCDYSYVFDLYNDTVIVNQEYIITRDNIVKSGKCFMEDEFPNEDEPLTEDHLNKKDTTVAFLINTLSYIRERNNEDNRMIDEAIQKVLERSYRK